MSGRGKCRTFVAGGGGQTPVTAAGSTGSVDPASSSFSAVSRPQSARCRLTAYRVQIAGGDFPYRNRAPVSCRKQFRFAAKCEINSVLLACMLDAICVPLYALLQLAAHATKTTFSVLRSLVWTEQNQSTGSTKPEIVVWRVLQLIYLCTVSI